MRDYRIHSRINIWTGKVVLNWNHYKSMLATIHTMFVNEKFIRIYSFCPFSPWNTRQMHFKNGYLNFIKGLEQCFYSIKEWSKDFKLIQNSNLKDLFTNYTRNVFFLSLMYLVKSIQKITKTLVHKTRHKTPFPSECFTFFIC